MQRVSVRGMKKEDAALMAALEKECFSEPWSEKALGEIVERPEYCYVVGCYEGEYAGHAGMVIAADEGMITNIAVDSQHRRKGIGRTMLQELLLLGKKRNVRVFSLEVRVSNTAAKAMYEAMGFEALAVRKNFYRNPTEDAAIMVFDKSHPQPLPMSE